MVVLGVSARCCLIAAPGLAWRLFSRQGFPGYPAAAFQAGCFSWWVLRQLTAGGRPDVPATLPLPPSHCERKSLHLFVQTKHVLHKKVETDFFFFSKPLVPRPGLSRDLCAPGFVEHMKASATHNVYVGHVLVHVLKHTSECWAWLCLHLWCPHRYNKEGFDVSQGKCKYLI